VFSGRKREWSPRGKPPKDDFVGFSHGDLSPRQAKIRQTVAENATHVMSRNFVWRGERSPCENTKKSPFGGFSRGDLSRFCLLFVVSLPGGAKGRHAKTRQMVILAGFRVATFRPARQRYDKQKAKRRRMKSVVLSCGGAKGRHGKHEQVTIWRVFAWRLFVFSPRKGELGWSLYFSYNSYVIDK